MSTRRHAADRREKRTGQQRALEVEALGGLYVVSTERTLVEAARAAATYARMATRDQNHLEWLGEAHAACAPLQTRWLARATSAKGAVGAFARGPAAARRPRCRDRLISAFTQQRRASASPRLILCVSLINILASKSPRNEQHEHRADSENYCKPYCRRNLLHALDATKASVTPAADAFAHRRAVLACTVGDAVELAVICSAAGAIARAPIGRAWDFWERLQRARHLLGAARRTL